jgi:hypothetical protein
MNNPAARLYEFTKKARSYGDGPPASLWASVFSLPYSHDAVKPEEIRGLVEALVAFQTLIDETEFGAHALEFEDFYFEPFPALRQVILASLSNLRGNHTGLQGPVTLEHETLLRVVATQWQKTKPEPDVDQKLLGEIQAEVQQLFEEVSDAEIDGDLKTLILSLMAEIQQAIEQYRIGGPERLRRALAFIVGQAALNFDMVEEAKTDKQSKVWWNRAQALVIKVYSAIKFANDTRQTIERALPFLRLLGPGDDIPPQDLP